MLETKFVGLAALRDEAVKGNKPFDYDKPIPGLSAPDRYTLRVELEEPRPGFAETFAGTDLFGAVAREVVEHYGEQIDAHPVGTGPFRLKSWRRSSEIVLERNPGYRERFYEAEPAANDAEGQAILARFKGRRLPMVDEVRVAIIEQSQPMWLSFLNAEVDALATNAGRVPPDFLGIAMPGGKIAPYLAKRGIQAKRNLNPDSGLAYFNMEDPVVGGYTPDKVALRRAISLGVDLDREIRLVRNNQAIPAQGVVAPGTWGYSPDFKSEMSSYDPARAKALLDMSGYVDRNGDGWRDQPDGSPLELEIATQPDQQTRRLDEQWRKNMNALGIRTAFRAAKWPENLKASTAGKLMMWNYGWLAAVPDSNPFLVLGYGPTKGQSNKSRFDLPAYNDIYRVQTVMPNGPERQAAIDEAQKLLVAYMPIKAHVHRVYTDLAQPWVLGYHRNPFLREAWRWIDIDTEMQARLAR